MSLSLERFRHLFNQYTGKKSSLIEVDEFFEAVSDPGLRDDLQTMIDERYKGLQQSNDTGAIDWDDMFNRIMKQAQKPGRIIGINQSRRWFIRIAAAASIVLMLGMGAYFLFFNKKKGEIAKSNPQDVEAPKDTKAMITLADGRKVSVDSLTTISQGQVQVKKTVDGKIIYSGNTTEVAYNTLTNPRGSKVIDMVLADGSHVWLNSGSSITYPIAFVSNERKVNITGEAYFEITHDASKPFYVSKADLQVQVLGTHFNVKAYDDESEIKVTLLEGSVKVTQLTTHDSRFIKPGQQVALTANGQLSTANPDLEEVMSWKNGHFQFGNASIETIMKEVSRWYDADIVYEDRIPGNFVADISRDLPVSKLLHILELTNRVHFRIESKKIIVLK